MNQRGFPGVYVEFTVAGTVDPRGAQYRPYPRRGITIPQLAPPRKEGKSGKVLKPRRSPRGTEDMEAKDHTEV